MAMEGATEFKTVADDSGDKKTTKFGEFSLIVSSVVLIFAFCPFLGGDGDCDVATNADDTFSSSGYPVSSITVKTGVEEREEVAEALI